MGKSSLGNRCELLSVPSKFNTAETVVHSHGDGVNGCSGEGDLETLVIRRLGFRPFILHIVDVAIGVMNTASISGAQDLHENPQPTMP